MKNKVRIFNIQKFSIHDGPGIRTTIFFKGCPLRCPWCSNPESQSQKIQLTWDHKKCTDCRSCEIKGLTFSKSNEKPYNNEAGFYINLINVDSEEKANHIISSCPTGAIGYEGKDMTYDEILEKVLDDKVFYQESGGGVTLSGGEVLNQIDEASEILRLCKENGIQTAAETTCYASEESFENFLKNLDILLCDIKHYDSKIHKDIVGVDLDLIHRNIRKATKKEGLRVIGRIPVIPGFNLSKEDANNLVDLIKELGIKEVNLLPFHNMGENKYELLNRNYQYRNFKNLDSDSEEFKEYKDIFVANKLTN